MVFQDIDANGLSEYQNLESSFDYDCVTCLWVADISFQGRPTIMLGTYGQVDFLSVFLFIGEVKRISKVWPFSVVRLKTLKRYTYLFYVY